MARKPFPVRLSTEERRILELRAAARGLPLGTYIRFRLLGPEDEHERRIAELEKRIRERAPHGQS